MYEFRNMALPARPPAGRQGGCGVLDRDSRLFLLDDDQLDAWNERVAICMVDGGLGQEEAEALAWREIEGQQAQPVDAHVGPRAASVAAGEEGANG
jgi:hypothetical protein